MFNMRLVVMDSQWLRFAELVYIRNAKESMVSAKPQYEG